MIHMHGMGNKTACGKTITKNTNLAPFSSSGYQKTTCKACKNKIKKIIGY